MKSILKGIISSFLLAGALLSLPSTAESQVFHTVRGLLASRFSDSERVTFVQVRPDAAQRRSVERRLGRRLPRAEYTFYVAATGARVDGYALFDEERGQHELISLATFFDARGRVTDVEVVAFREPYGDGIRGRRFRRQFVGRNGQSGFRPGRDIDAVSGSTLSSRAMTIAVQRATVLLEQAMIADGAGSSLARR